MVRKKWRQRQIFSDLTEGDDGGKSDEGGYQFASLSRKTHCNISKVVVNSIEGWKKSLTEQLSKNQEEVRKLEGRLDRLREDRDGQVKEKRS